MSQLAAPPIKPLRCIRFRILAEDAETEGFDRGFYAAGNVEPPDVIKLQREQQRSLVEPSAEAISNMLDAEWPGIARGMFERIIVECSERMRRRRGIFGGQFDEETEEFADGAEKVKHRRRKQRLRYKSGTELKQPR